AAPTLEAGFPHQVGERSLRHAARAGQVSDPRLGAFGRRQRADRPGRPPAAQASDTADPPSWSVAARARRVAPLPLSDRRGSLPPGARTRWEVAGVLAGLHPSVVRDRLSAATRRPVLSVPPRGLFGRRGRADRRPAYPPPAAHSSRRMGW